MANWYFWKWAGSSNPIPESLVEAMRSVVRASSATLTPEILHALALEIHDRWFNLEEIEFDQVTQIVKIALALKRTGPFDRTLQLTGVVSMEVLDQARVRDYDINFLEFDPATNSATLVSCIPLRITFNLEPCWEVLVH